MNPTVSFWLLTRALRWACWLAFAVVCGLYLAHPSAYLNSFGHLLPAMELLMFGTSLAAVFIGLIEMMMRERAGLSTPTPWQLIPPKTDGAPLVR